MNYDNWKTTDRDWEQALKESEALAVVCEEIEGELDAVLKLAAEECGHKIEPCLAGEEGGDLLVEVNLWLKAIVRQGKRKQNAVAVAEQLEQMANSIREQVRPTNEQQRHQGNSIARQMLALLRRFVPWTRVR